MDLVAENIDDVVVLNLESICNGPQNVGNVIGHQTCKTCSDVSGLIHNWLMSVDTEYVIIDLQDEKEICSTFLIEVLQLKKRIEMPFIFAGVMPKTRDILEAYGYSRDGLPAFESPDEAVKYLKRKFRAEAKASHRNITFGEKILSLRARQLQKMGEASSDDGDDLDN